MRDNGVYARAMPGHMRKRSAQRAFATLLGLFIAVALHAAQPLPPSTLFQDLYARVQNEHLFPDSKTFADAVPKKSPAAILADYRAKPPGTKAALAPSCVSDSWCRGRSTRRCRATREARDWDCRRTSLHYGQCSRARPLSRTRLVSTAAELAIRRAGWPLPRDVLLGFVFHDARSGSRRPARHRAYSWCATSRT